jgi:hypothetical protein
MDVTDELLNLSPTTSNPQEVAAGTPNRPSDADLRPLEPLPQAPQSRYPAAADPGPMNPEHNRRLSVYPHVEVERTADVCPPGPARDAGDQGRNGRVIWAGPRSEPARQGRGRARSFDSGHGNASTATRPIRERAPRTTPRIASATTRGYRPRKHGSDTPSARPPFQNRSKTHRNAPRRVTPDNKEARKPAWLRASSRWAVPGSNQRPPACKAGALPTELTALAVRG